MTQEDFILKSIVSLTFKGSHAPLLEHLPGVLYAAGQQLTLVPHGLLLIGRETPLVALDLLVQQLSLILEYLHAGVSVGCRGHSRRLRWCHTAGAGQQHRNQLVLQINETLHVKICSRLKNVD